MADTVTKAVRSRVMRSIPSQGTSPEILLRLALAKRGLRGWRLNDATLPGKPDFAFSKQRLAVFVDGCFWHGCLRCYRGPKSNAYYWRTKLRLNQARDVRNADALKRQGWRILRVWEHQVRDEPVRCVRLVQTLLRKASRAAKFAG